jgi:hypothetical protein
MNQESAPGLSLQGLTFRAALQRVRRDLIKGFQGVLQGKPTRAAGRESKSFCFPSCLKFLLAQGA